MTVDSKGRDLGDWVPPPEAVLAHVSRVTVLFFGAAADRAGTRETSVAVEDALTLDELWELLVDRYPDLRPMRKTISFAVN